MLARSETQRWAIEVSPRRLRIQTLDAFCAGIAQTLPLTSGMGGQPSIVQDAAAHAIYRRAALATLDWLVEDSPMSTAIEKVLTHLDTDSSAYTASIAEMLSKRDQWLAFIGTGHTDAPDALRATLESGIERVVKQHLADLRARLEPVLGSEAAPLAAYAGQNVYAAGNATSPIASLNGLDGLPGSDVEDFPAWCGLAELLLTKSGKWRRTVNESHGFPRGDEGQKEAWLALLRALPDDRSLLDDLTALRELPGAAYPDEQWRVLLALLEVLPIAVGELKRVFAQERVCDYAEVALCAEAALVSGDEPGQAALLLDHRLQHVLVDEMQDTSVSQYRLLEALVAGWQPEDGRTFFCVGDPMQSIYRFRNAEVGQFMRIQAGQFATVSLEALTLRRNFRSVDRLVHWFNEAFAAVFPANVDLAAGAVSYSPSTPVPHRVATGGDGYHIHAVLDGSVVDEANATTDVVASLLQETDSDDLALLVRGRAQLTELSAVLRAREIPYAAIEIDRLTDLPEIIDVQALTRACLHPGDRAAWLAVLRGPWIGLDWSDLHTLVHERPEATVWELLNDADSVHRLSGRGQRAIGVALPVLHEARRGEGGRRLRETVETAWYQLGGPAFLKTLQELENVYRYFDVVERADRNGALNDPAKLGQLLDDERVSSSADGDCRLQIMTMHKAKGLQFDHVILPSLGRYSKSTAPSVLSWTNMPSENGVDVLLSPVGPRNELERDKLHRFIETAQRRRERLELDRLLYVACTRAKRSLHLVTHIERDRAGKVKQPHRASLLHRLWPAIEQDVVAQLDGEEQRPPKPKPQNEGWLQPYVRYAKEPWRYPQIGEPPGNAELERRTPATERTVSYRWVGAVARQAGVLTHRWLERFAKQRAWPQPDALDETDALTRAWATGYGVLDEHLDEVCRQVRRALENMLADSRGIWILDGPGHAELPLSGISGGQLASVVIDRVRITDDSHWVIDYKTGGHEGGNLETFLNEEVARYTPQLALYADLYSEYAPDASVHTALYFPLLRAFVEVDVNKP